MQRPGNLISRSFSAFVAGMNSVGTVLIFGLVILINLDVFSRFLFNAPIDGVTELVEKYKNGQRCIKTFRSKFIFVQYNR